MIGGGGDSLRERGELYFAWYLGESGFWVLGIGEGLWLIGMY